MARIPGAQRLAGLWLNLSLPAKGGAIVAIPVICTFSMMVLLADMQRRFEGANQAVVHSQQVLSQSRDLLAATLSAEATMRGYLLTREPAFLDLHRNARRRLSNAFSRILSLTEDNPGQQEHMRHAMRLMHEEIAALDAELQMSGAPLTAAVNASRLRLDNIGKEISDFEAEEYRLAADRRGMAFRHRDRLRLGLWGFCIVGALSAVLGSLLFTTSVKQRLLRISANAERFALRESEGPVDGSGDAIGRLEETLIATTRSLLDRERRLSANAAELERAKLAAEAAVEAKTAFVANISHEIRSPMNALLGAAELLGGTSPTSKQAEYLRLLDRAGHNLLSVVDEVLDHAKIEAGHLILDKAPFDLRATVTRVAELMSLTASDKGLELLTRVSPAVSRHLIGDAKRLQRVLINLVSNAIKFTQSGFVSIQVEPSNVAGLVHFTVADTGIGIPKDRQEVIFQQFTQASTSTTREYGGTGLGLAICKHIVGLMEGRIWVESEAGAGSAFHFTVALPAGDAPRPAPRAVPEFRDRLAGRILLADDSAPSVAIIRAFLASTACSLEVAGDGEAALERLTAGRYDLVLMDVQMPKLDGYEAMRRFRELERAQGRPRTPIVAVTAHAFQEDIDNAIKAGADAQLTKPFRRDSLLAAIRLYQRPEGGPDVRVNVPEFIRGLAPEFLRRQRCGLLTLEISLDAGEFDAIQSFAHNMKGCGKSFGFQRLTDLGREIERAAMDRDAATLRGQIEELREYLTEVDVA